MKIDPLFVALKITIEPIYQIKLNGLILLRLMRVFVINYKFNIYH